MKNSVTETLPFHPSMILFDMDGVILDSMSYHEAAWREVLLAAGVETSPEDIYRREGMSGVPSVKEIFRDKGVPVPEDAVIEELIEQKHSIFSGDRIDLFEGVAPLVKGLAEAGITLGLVTGSHITTVNQCLPFRVREAFQVIVTADDVKEGKPSPEPYLAALEKTGISRQKALVVENAPMGIASAKAAGLYCIAIETTLPEEYLESADMIVKNHRELTALFKDQIAHI